MCVRVLRSTRTGIDWLVELTVFDQNKKADKVALKEAATMFRIGLFSHSRTAASGGPYQTVTVSYDISLMAHSGMYTPRVKSSCPPCEM